MSGFHLSHRRGGRGVRRYVPGLGHALEGTLLEDRALTAPTFYRIPGAQIGTYTSSAGTYVPDDTLGGPTVVSSPPTVGDVPDAVQSSSSQGSFNNMSQFASGTLHNQGVVPPYSTTSVFAAEFAVAHQHSETGNSFGAPAGGLEVRTEAQGQDGWAIDQWQDATVTVDFSLSGNVPSLYSITHVDINFQSNYFGFSVVGDVNGPSTYLTITFTDGSGQTTSTETFTDSTGLLGEEKHFTVPAQAGLQASFDSTLYTQFYGGGLEPVQSQSEQQSLEWHVGFTVN